MTKVTVCGAAGGTGQTLSLLLKHSDLITHLALYDIINAHGVATDLSHIDNRNKVTGHVGPSELEEAIKNADVVIISAGVPRKPGMSRNDLFKVNASIVRDLAIAAAMYAPKAFICVISNPVNSTVPIVSEVFKRYEVYNPRKIFGVTTLDLVRTSTFLAELLGEDLKNTHVPVIGGHHGHTIIPLISQAIGVERLDEKQVEDLITRIQFAGDEVIRSKDGAGSAILSMANAGARFTISLLESAFGDAARTECAYVSLAADNEGAAAVKRIAGEIEYFAIPIELGKDGVQKIAPIGKISKSEYKILASASQELKESISKGAAFVIDDIKL